MIRPSSNRHRRLVPLWLLATVLVWLVAAALDRRTEVVADTYGQHLRLRVAGTELSVPRPTTPVQRITLLTAVSIDPPGLLGLELDAGHGWRALPEQSSEPTTDGPAPVGDWWVDDHCSQRVVVDHPLELDGAFELRASLTGRFSRELAIVLHGDPTSRLGLRRGAMDSYLVIRSEDGTVVDATTLDPTPAADLGALLAQLLRAAAAACLVIAVISLAPTSLKRSPARRPSPSPGTPQITVGIVALALLGAGISAWFAHKVLVGLPHQIDEVVYLLQARWLLDGAASAPVSAIQEHLRVPFTYLVDGRWVGHYPVGWPFLLAVGLAAGAPHLVNTVLSAVLIVLLFLIGRELDDDLTGLVAAVLAAVSPLLRILGGSMFPHVACAVLVGLAIWLLLLARRRTGWWLGFAAGTSMGCCLALRPMAAVAVSAVLGGWLMLRAATPGGRAAGWRTVAATVLGGLAASIPTLVHNTAVTGSPLSLPYSLTSGAMYDISLIPFGLRNLDAILASASAGFFGWGWPVLFSGLAPALSLAFAMIPFLLRRARPEDRLLLAVLVVVAIGHLPTRAHGLHGFGARYMVDAAPCLVLLTARGFRELARLGPPSRAVNAAVVTLVVALNLATLASMPQRLELYRGYDGVTGALELELDATGLDRAIILIDDADWQPWGEAARLMTGPRRHDVVVAADLGDNSALSRRYPDRPVLRWDGRQLHRKNGAPR